LFFNSFVGHFRLAGSDGCRQTQMPASVVVNDSSLSVNAANLDDFPRWALAHQVRGTAAPPPEIAHVTLKKFLWIVSRQEKKAGRF